VEGIVAKFCDHNCCVCPCCCKCSTVQCNSKMQMIGMSLSNYNSGSAGIHAAVRCRGGHLRWFDKQTELQNVGSGVLSLLRDGS